VPVTGLTGVTALSVGPFSACAIIAGGKVSCWGLGSEAENGDEANPVPVPIPGISGATAISDNGTACAVLADHTVHCWAQATPDPVTHAFATAPYQVPDIASAVQVAAGATSCAVLADRTVDCWGTEPLGDGTTTSSNTPVQVPGITDAVAVAIGGHNCVLHADGTVSCWGEPGDTTYPDSGPTLSPEPVAGVSGAIALWVGAGDTCVTLVGGTAECWGANGYGSLGDGTNANSSTPQAMHGVDDVASISANDETTLVTLTDGQLRFTGAPRLADFLHEQPTAFPVPVTAP
jgi:alpha-tubulin suppressor-like RCC1 family protein